MSTWLTLLTRRAVELRRDLDRLAQMKATWTKTRDAAQVGQSPGVVLQQIEAALASIEAAQLPLKTREETVLDCRPTWPQKSPAVMRCWRRSSRPGKSAVEGILRRESSACLES